MSELEHEIEQTYAIASKELQTQIDHELCTPDPEGTTADLLEKCSIEIKNKRIKSAGCNKCGCQQPVKKNNGPQLR